MFIKIISLTPLALVSARSIIAVLIQTLEPIFNPIWVFLVIGELPSFWALLGGLIVLTAVTGRAIIAAKVANRLTQLGQT